MIIKNSDFFSSYGTFNQLPSCGKKEIVFSGRSNVGKSSLINKICNKKNMARTSSTPGKTSTINFYSVNDFYFVDLPGYGYAKTSDRERSRWSNLIDGYFNSGRDIRLVVQLLDCRIPPTKDDVLMLDYLTSTNTPFIIALTKGDKLKKSQQKTAVQEYKKICEEFNFLDIFLISTIKNFGIEEIKNAIEVYIN